ncbi:MAG: anaerobic ribonucleoside-triphosphate reductase activating protein [Candidatus Staskawiczbacteria bacterium]|nr:anaerobic ribonucleoside-triphosphate reductase activating protein [Candidatus Staskawiczbacteria bacterium]
MIIAGLQRTTLIDYPGKLACVVFLAGCNFRCPWCYSRELVLPLEIAQHPRISEKEFFDFLRQRKGLLDGVVICGGEPTINKDLPLFIEKIKTLGYAVKLDTNGSNPEMLKNLVDLRLIDYVAMDIKTSPESPVYKNLMIEEVTINNIKESVEFLKAHSTGSGQTCGFEFRTTCVPGVHQKEDFIEIAKWIGGQNVKYYLQGFRGEKTIDPAFEKIQPFKDEFLQGIAKEISSNFKECKVR